MATVEDIIRDVQEEVVDESYPMTRMMTLMNEGCMVVSAGVFPQWQEIGEICLPNLETSGTVTATSSQAYASLPSDFQKKIVSVFNEGNRRWCTLHESVDMLRRYFIGLDNSGTVTDCARSGSNLYYQSMENTTLTVRYFKKPTTLTAGDTPDFLPDHVQLPILRNYILFRMPTKYTDKLGYNPIDEFRMYLAQLWGHVGNYVSEFTPVRDIQWDYYEDDII